MTPEAAGRELADLCRTAIRVPENAGVPRAVYETLREVHDVLRREVHPECEALPRVPSSIRVVPFRVLLRLTDTLQVWMGEAATRRGCTVKEVASSLARQVGIEGVSLDLGGRVLRAAE